MDQPAVLLLAAGALVGLGFWLRSIVERAPPRREGSTAPDPPSPEPPPEPPPAPARSIEEIVRDLEPHVGQGLSDQPPFSEGITLLARSDVPLSDVVGYFLRRDDVALQCMAVVALSIRPDGRNTVDTILAEINDQNWVLDSFMLAALDRMTPPNEPIVGRLLLALRQNGAPGPGPVRHFVRSRLARGERCTFGDGLAQLPAEGFPFLRNVLANIADLVGDTLLREFDEREASCVDRARLAGMGRIEPPATGLDELIVDHPALAATLDELEASLLGDPARSALLVGPLGVGKSTTSRAFALRAMRGGWTVFEARARDLLAGQVYVGQLEERLAGLLDAAARRRRVLWIAPDFQDLLWAGQHSRSPVGILDMVLPAIADGRIVVLGRIEPSVYERLVVERPAIAGAMRIVRVAPLDGPASVDLAVRWTERRAALLGPPAADRAAIEEAWQLAQQYLGDSAAPGNLLLFLRLAIQGAEQAERRGPLDRHDLIAALARLSGLPESILDERRALDVEALRGFFEQQVMGQGEAIDCLVERIAMIKAGVTDPTRPLGVFLFVGPTGTGKTELAKLLARFLFGSERRMVRLDMSEFQSPDSLGRLLGEGDAAAGEALVNQVRRQPFTVVLLDEFEKAHPNVWDLFLQVFDDGRLTDRLGRTTDMRQSIIILTSNLGAAVPTGTSPGFSGSDRTFSRAAVERTVGQVFRKEFLNRIDRVVVFEPLQREAMREILKKELHDAFERRGLRSRGWAVEFDESAIAFLLAHGFTIDMGARPLKRAIERHLLAPLAATIVNRQYPQGQQFLFVSAARDRLRVEFVDPDAPAAPPAAADVAERREAASLEAIALDPHGTPEELATIDDRLAELRALIEGDEWVARKREALAQTGGAAFWNSPGRFEVLALAEYLDRIDTALENTAALLGRFGAKKAPRDFVGRLAQKLVLIGAACDDVLEGRPRDAFLSVEAGADTGRARLDNNAFAVRLAEMYRAWAERRGMRLAVLVEEPGAERGPFRAIYAVSGFAAYSVLRPEEGGHVLEVPRNEGRVFYRCHAEVRVRPQPTAPPGATGETLLDQARQALGEGSESPAVVRRYREEPSPLVRDAARGWRTGRVDRVFAGDFDLLATRPEPS